MTPPNVPPIKPDAVSTAPPEAWIPARRLARAVARPVEEFLRIQAAGGILLLVAAAAALAWANSPWHESYERLWHTPVALGLGDARFSRSLHFWINDGLMAVFFLVVGLEIKRELVHGALADLKRAMLPIAAAVGGMLVPAATYLALNPSGDAHRGWGITMATDIAFAVGILALLGKRVPAAMRVLLLAVAIVDDIGAILVIAVFYSSGIDAGGVVVALGGMALLFGFLRIGIRPGWIYAIPFAVLWVGCYRAGVHPTIAGVIAGLMIPAHSWLRADRFLEIARGALEDFGRRAGQGDKGHDLMKPLQQLAFAQREAVAPVTRLESALHPWVAYGIMPVFALANAGVYLGGIEGDGAGTGMVLLGVLLGLALGKPAGVLAMSWLAVRLKLGVLPAGIGWQHVAVVGIVAGIGFTMAIFIAELAFGGTDYLGIAKLGVLAGTGVAAVAALALGRLGLAVPPVAEPSEGDVEASTDYWTTAERSAAPPPR